VRGLLFESLSTTAKTLLIDRVRIALLVYEPRINMISLDLDTSMQHEGRVVLELTYEVRSTNSRFNLVYPFNITDGNGLSGMLGQLRAWERNG
jgi:hypothetical protein